MRLAYVTVFAFALVGGSAAANAQQTTEDKQALTDRLEQLERAVIAIQQQLTALKGSVAQQPEKPAPSAAANQAGAPAVPVTPAQAKTPATAETTTAQTTPKAAPATRPGSSNPTTGSVNPDAIYNLRLGANQPTTAEQVQHRWMEKKPGRDLTFYTKTGQITAYGNIDLSIDTATKGLGSMTVDGVGPVGNMGWLEDISTNQSYLGVRGTQITGMKDVNFIYQLETQIEVSAAPGTSQTNSEEQNTVQGTLFTRNSYIGLGSVKGGAVLFGKTDAPYKQSTARMNPFSGMEGDYSNIMGNTGGDNRVEFGIRLDHSIWYTSPDLHGYQFNVLFSPGQNRSNVSDNIAAGEAICTGGLNPGSGGDVPDACNDGAFSDAVSANVSYTSEPLYIVAAYERHMKVNRQSDLTAIYGAPASNYNGPTAGFTGPTLGNPALVNSSYTPLQLYDADVADEDAAKIGIQYAFFHKKTVVNALFESMHRYVPYYLEFQNERQRMGNWISGTQAIGSSDSLSIGWAHAYRTPGDPGQHNDSFVPAPYSVLADGDVVSGRAVDNAANMYTVAFRHRIGDGLEVYSDWAGTFNHQYAHYVVGDGHGVKTDGHDAYDAVGNEFSNPHIWAGGHLQAFSIGLDKKF
jgi:predicted porin